MSISLFRLICIVQFLLTGYMAVVSFTDIFETPGWQSVISFIAFCMAIFLVAFLLQVMHKNHPDEPLSVSQKSRFNWLFIFNFLLLAVLLSFNINDVKITARASGNTFNILSTFFYINVILNLLISIFQVYILVNMVKLRRSLNANFEKKVSDMDILAR